MSWLRAVHFVDARTGWAAGGRGVLLRTSDGGASWKLMPRPSEDTLRDVHFTSALSGWLVCDQSDYAPQLPDQPRSYLLRTADGGMSWSRVEPTGADTEVRLTRVVFADAARGWAFGEAGALYATLDEGRTWAQQEVPTRHLLLGGAFLDAQRGWLVGAGSTLLYTSDGGASWRAGRLEGIARDDEDAPAFGQRAQTPAVVAASAGQAPPARAAKTNARLNAVCFADAARGWAVGARGRIFATADGGRTWRAQASGVTDDLFDVKFVNQREGWVAGAGGTLLHTADGGASWSIVPSGTTHTIERLCFADAARGWAVGFGGTVLAYTARPGAKPGAAPKLKGAGAN